MEWDCVYGVQDLAKAIPEQSQDRTVLGEAAGPEMMVRVYMALCTVTRKCTRDWGSPLFVWQVTQQWWLDHLGLHKH